MPRSRKRYSYIKKKIATGTWESIVAGSASLVFMLAAIVLSVMHEGEGPLLVGALGLSSLFLSVLALWYVSAGIRQAERNRLGVRLAGIGSSIVTLMWVLLIFVGLRLS